MSESDNTSKLRSMCVHNMHYITKQVDTVLYHKVECKVYLFHSPLAHINDPLFTSLQETAPRKKRGSNSTALEMLLHRLEVNGSSRWHSYQIIFICFLERIRDVKADRK
jgi:hypothetical protein